jgi:hypothetical protein
LPTGLSLILSPLRVHDGVRGTYKPTFTPDINGFTASYVKVCTQQQLLPFKVAMRFLTIVSMLRNDTMQGLLLLTVYAFTSGVHMKGIAMTVLCLRQASGLLISRRTTTFSPARR